MSIVENVKNGLARESVAASVTSNGIRGKITTVGKVVRNSGNAKTAVEGNIISTQNDVIHVIESLLVEKIIQDGKVGNINEMDIGWFIFQTTNRCLNIVS